MEKIDVSKFKEEIESRIAKAMIKNNLPGMAISLIHKDRIIYSRGFGSRDLNRFLPFTSDTLNGFASCTKSLTALGIMKLQKDGKLNVNDPVSDYIPFKLGFKDRPITIHHLLTHTSGMPSLGIYWLVVRQNFPTDPGIPPIPFGNLDDFYIHVNHAKNEVLYKPGERFYYSNSGYTLLGLIIEKVSGLKYEDFIRKHILDPLSMKRSSFVALDMSKEDALSIPYVILPDKDNKPKLTAADFPFNPFFYAACGIVSSCNEMANYVIMSMNKGKFEDTQIFDTELISEMQRMHYSGEGAAWDIEVGQSGYGYGWTINEDFFDNTLIMHRGGITGGSSLIGFLKELKIGFTAIGNTNGLPFNEILAALTSLIGKDPEKDLPLIVRSNHNEKLCGNYTSYKDIHRLTIVIKQGVLFLESKTPPSSVPLLPKDDGLEPLDYYILSTLGDKTLVQFRFDEDDKIHFTLESTYYHKID
ncbi:MAG: serine hydrolase domain-containing protein [Promethearchaeota archaeon]